MQRLTYLSSLLFFSCFLSFFLFSQCLFISVIFFPCFLQLMPFLYSLCPFYIIFCSSLTSNKKFSSRVPRLTQVSLFCLSDPSTVCHFLPSIRKKNHFSIFCHETTKKRKKSFFSFNFLLMKKVELLSHKHFWNLQIFLSNLRLTMFNIQVNLILRLGQV